jgi:hypothetical protein
MPKVFKTKVCVEAVYRQGNVYLSYSDGRKLSFPISINRRLRNQPEEKLSKILVGHYGISWPELDEDLSHADLRSGRFGQS